MLPSIIVLGIPSVVRAVMARQEKDNSKFNLIVEGTGLKTVMITEGVDYTKTVTNHLMEIENVLGIEAARSTIIKEI